MNDRRRLLVALGAGALAVPIGVFAQQQSDVPRIGLLWIDLGTTPHYLAALREALHAQGYMEGKNIQIDDRFLVKGYEQLEKAAAKLVAEKVEVIVCFGATATQAAAKATSSIPIVTLTGNDPVKLGLAVNLARPGKNVTGMTFISADMAGKRLELLKEARPRIRHVGVVMSTVSKSEAIYFQELETAARSLNLEVRSIGIPSPERIDAVIAGASDSGVGGLIVVAGTLLTAHRRQVVKAVEKTRLPAVYSSSDYTDVGGLISYSPNVGEGFARIAVFIDKILKGASPGDLPIERPTKFDLVVNMKTAKALGVKIPDSILVRADRLIE
jgi:putative ABC transport system substrate-binding protein